MTGPKDAAEPGTPSAATPTAPTPAAGPLSPASLSRAVLAAARAHIKSLLDFVAWVAYQKSPNLRIPPAWIKGRGGFLMDEFKDVEAACKRVQVQGPL